MAFNSAAFGIDGVHLFNPADTLTLENTLLVQAEGGETACSKVADSVTNSLATDADDGDEGEGGGCSLNPTIRRHSSLSWWFLPGAIGLLLLWKRNRTVMMM